ncbi:MAG: TrkA family potassium uptake protein [Chloroflexota bacterium]|nr:TrkA family potassium uptake protein [Chloroflexota bacterium]
MKRRVAIIGLGRFGSSLAKALFEMGHDVLAIDTNEKLVRNIAPHVTHAVQADATDEMVLEELGVPASNVAVVTIGDAIQSSVLCTILLKKLGVRYVIARADEELHGSILEKIGANKVVYPEREMGIKLAHGLTLTDVLDFMPVAPSGYGVVKLMAPSYFVGKTIADLGLGHEGKWHVALLLIQRGREILVTPSRSDVVQSNDTLIVAGTDEQLEKLLTDAKKSHDKR